MKQPSWGAFPFLTVWTFKSKISWKVSWGLISQPRDGGAMLAAPQRFDSCQQSQRLTMLDDSNREVGISKSTAWTGSSPWSFWLQHQNPRWLLHINSCRIHLFINSLQPTDKTQTLRWSKLRRSIVQSDGTEGSEISCREIFWDSSGHRGIHMLRCYVIKLFRCYSDILMCLINWQRTQLHCVKRFALWDGGEVASCW